MAQIPKFEREKLASSLVGTPGVDPSGQFIAESVSQSANKVADTAFKVAAKRQEAKDMALANKTLVGLDRDLEDQLREHQKQFSEFRGDKTERIKAFETNARSLFQDRISQVPSENARMIVERYGERTLMEKIMKESDVADRNQAVLAENDIIDSANILAQRSADLWSDAGTSLDEKLGNTQQILMQGEQTFETSKIVFDPKTRDKLKKLVPEMIAKGAVSGGLDKNPEQIFQALNDGTFDEILDPGQIKTLKDEAQTAIPKVREKMKLERTIAEIGSYPDLWNAYKSGDRTVLQQIENMPDTEFTREMRSMILKGSSDPVTSAETIISLQSRFNGMLDEKAKTVKDSVKLEDLRGFMVDVVTARKRGDLTDSQADTFMKKMATPMFERIKQGRSTLGWFDGPGAYAQGYRFIDDWARRNKFKKDSEVKSSVYLDFLDLMEKEQSPTKEVMIENAREAVERYVRGTNPSVGLLRRLPDKVLKTNDTFVNANPQNKDDRKDIPVAGKVATRKRLIQRGGPNGPKFNQWLDAEGKVIEERPVTNG